MIFYNKILYNKCYYCGHSAVSESFTLQIKMYLSTVFKVQIILQNVWEMPHYLPSDLIYVEASC